MDFCECQSPISSDSTESRRIHCDQAVLAQPRAELPEILLLHSQQESKIFGMESAYNNRLESKVQQLDAGNDPEMGSYTEWMNSASTTRMCRVS